MPPRGMRPLKAAAALACLVGLAACGGGGGGSVASDPTPPGPWFLEQDATKVTALNGLIAAHTPNVDENSVSTSRLADQMTYTVTATDSDRPVITIGGLNSDSIRTPLKEEHLGGNSWRFTDTYTAVTGVNYEGTVLLFIDTELDAAGQAVNWRGIWLRENTDTGTWDEIRSLNRYLHPTRPQAGADDMVNIMGTATFTGTANGLYTKNAATAGWFSADASLDVTFGGSDVDIANRYTMTGTIGNFVLSGQEENSWSVQVTASATKDGTGAPLSDLWSGTADGGGTVGAASIDFYGSSATGVQPDATIGTFNAQFSDGMAAGSFTARRNQ